MKIVSTESKIINEYIRDGQMFHYCITGSVHDEDTDEIPIHFKRESYTRVNAYFNEKAIIERDNKHFEIDKESHIKTLL